MADPCPRCRRPLFDVSGSGLQLDRCMAHIDQAPPGETIGCREAELSLVRSQLAAAKALTDRARLLLIRTRDQLDLAILETQQEPEADRG